MCSDRSSTVISGEFLVMAFDYSLLNIFPSSVPQSIILSHAYPYEINWTEAMFNQYILLSNDKFLIDFCDRFSLTDEMIENLVKK